LFEKSDRLPTHYWRYVDDVWGLWEHGIETIQEFHKLANSLHLRIKTELLFASQQIEFLDVKIKIKDGFIQTDLFSKDTEKIHVLACNIKSSKRGKDRNSMRSRNQSKTNLL
jgi:hypothetical protein